MEWEPLVDHGKQVLKNGKKLYRKYIRNHNDVVDYVLRNENGKILGPLWFHARNENHRQVVVNGKHIYEKRIGHGPGPRPRRYITENGNLFNMPAYIEKLEEHRQHIARTTDLSKMRKNFNRLLGSDPRSVPYQQIVGVANTYSPNQLTAFEIRYGQHPIRHATFYELYLNGPKLPMNRVNAAIKIKRALRLEKNRRKAIPYIYRPESMVMFSKKPAFINAARRYLAGDRSARTNLMRMMKNRVPERSRELHKALITRTLTK